MGPLPEKASNFGHFVRRVTPGHPSHFSWEFVEAQLKLLQDRLKIGRTTRDHWFKAFGTSSVLLFWAQALDYK